MDKHPNGASLELTDDEIEALALKHIAPGYERLRAVVPEFAPYKDSEQFRRVKALLAEAQHRLRASAGEDRDIWLVCLSREYYDGGDSPLLAVPTEAMAEQVAADLLQYCRDLRERMNAYDWQTEPDPEKSNKLYEESEAVFAAAQFPYGVALARYNLDDGFNVRPLTLRAPTEIEASAEPLVRYCPGCGSVGPVGDGYRDCCPDGGEARTIPAPLAEKCRDTFKIAVKALRADAAANEAMANQVPAITEEYTLRAMARNYTDRHSWDKLDSKAVTAAADEIRALRAALAARAQLPENGDAHG